MALYANVTAVGGYHIWKILLGRLLEQPGLTQVFYLLVALFLFFFLFCIVFLLYKLIIDSCCSSFSLYEETLSPSPLNPDPGRGSTWENRGRLLGGGFFHWLLLFLLLATGTPFSLSVNP